MSLSFITYASPTGNVNVLTDLVFDNKHVQILKLIDGTTGGTEGIPGNLANGLDVDVTRIIPGTAATNLGKAEDATHTTGDVGVLALAVRRDQTYGFNFTSNNGDYGHLSVNAYGQLWVTCAPEVSVNEPGDTYDPNAIPDPRSGLVMAAWRNDSGGAPNPGTNHGFGFLQLNATHDLRATIERNLRLAGGSGATYAHATDPGMMIVGVRNEAVTSLVSADGKFCPIATTQAGEVIVRLGTMQAGAAKLVKAEDDPSASGDLGVMVLAVRRDDTEGITPTNNVGDYGTFIVNAYGRLWTCSGSEVYVNNAGITYDPDITGDPRLAVMLGAWRNDAGGLPATSADKTFSVLQVNATGYLRVVGAAEGAGGSAHGATPRGVLMHGSDGTSYRPLLTTDTGILAAQATTTGDRIFVASAALLIKQANFSITGSDQSVVALVASKRIRVISIVFTCTADCTVTWKSNSTTLINSMPFAAKGGMDCERAHGHFLETAVGEALKASVSAGTVVGSLCYLEVP